MLFFLLYLFLETIISVNISSMLGGFNTFLEILLSAIFGIILFRQVGFSNISRLSELQKGKLNPNDVARDSIFKLVGSLMLIFPGFFSDILGVLFQFSFFTSLVATYFFKNTKTTYRSSVHEKDTIIDVDVVDDDNPNNSISRR